MMAHFTSEKKVLSVAILDLMKLQKEHSGENQTIIILNMLNDYKIRNKLDYIIINNIYSNNTFINVIAVFLKNKRVAYNAYKRRHKCNDHVINLTV